MIKKNPFTSTVFIKMWNKHFKNKVSYKSVFIKDITFYKPMRYLPLFINIGKNLSKGISYKLESDYKIVNKHKVYLIFDIPQYFNQETHLQNKNLKVFKIRQYPGFITKLNNYENFNDFISKQFSKKSKYKFKSYKRKLEDNFNISYVNYNHTTTEDEYNYLFETFYELLSKRFEEKSQSNNNLNEQEWNFYKALVFPLLKNKSASLFVVLNNNKPIAISLNYFSENILFFAMTSFDIEYKNYNVGTVHLMELFKWCFENDIEVFDFSKGYYDYKERWGDTKYVFENHIFYDSKSISSTFIAYATASFFRLKQFLRDKNIGGILNKFTYYIKR